MGATLPEGMWGEALLQRAIREADAAFVPGRGFFHDDGGAITIGLSYSLPDASEIIEGIRRLSSLCGNQRGIPWRRMDR